LPAVYLVAKELVILAFEQIEKVVRQRLVELVMDHELSFGAAGLTGLAALLGHEPCDRLAGLGDDTSSPRRTRSISVDRLAFAS
jgi:hypothetical protein